MTQHENSRVLFITHNGLTEPLGRRQVLPYLVGLSARGWRFDVLSFEKRASAPPAAVAAVRELTAAAGIRWRALRYHRRPPIVATAVDLLRGAGIVRRMREQVCLVHARSTVPAAMARIGVGAVRPWLFDVRGLLGEEYADAGHWRRGGWRHRVTSEAETRLRAAAAAVVVLTRHAASQLGRSSTVIPCCVDMEVFRPCDEWRRDTRRELGWTQEPVLVYSGSLGSWYRLAEMFDFFRVAAEELPSLRFMVLTRDTETAEREARLRGILPRVRVLAVAPDEVPRLLAAADAGVCFLGRHASKLASSPTKFGEYLASGLPVVTNPWIGDAQSLAGEPAWLLVDDFAEASYRRCARRLGGLLAGEATRGAARDLARREFDLGMAVDRYDAVYRAVLGPDRARP